MKGKHKRKTSAIKSDPHGEPPLPGLAGLEVLDRLEKQQYNEALDLFYEAFIADPGMPPEVEILEDDGDSIIFISDRGPFRFTGVGRMLLLMVLKAAAGESSEEQQGPTS
jgi:hypothetical protein